MNTLLIFSYYLILLSKNKNDSTSRESWGNRLLPSYYIYKGFLVSQAVKIKGTIHHERSPSFLEIEELIKVKNSYILKNPYQLLEKKGNKYLQLVSKLETLSPLLTLQRGYTMTKKEGKVITKSTDVKKKDIIEIVFSDGSVNAEIK